MIDIAIEIYFNNIYKNNDKEYIIGNIKDFPLLIEYYKNWLLENYDSKKISDDYLLELIEVTSKEHYIQNKILCSIIESKCFNDFINNNKDIILNRYLENIIYTFILSYNIQNKVLLVDEAIILLKFICNNIEYIDINDKIIELIFIFSNTIYNYRTDNNNILEELSKIIYEILKTAIDKKCYNKDSIIIICKSIIKLSPYIKNEFEEFLDNINNLEFNHISNLLIMDEEYSEIVAEYFPDELIKLFFNNVIENNSKDIHNIIKYTYKVKYASGLVPPFYFLFKYHYKKAIDFVIRFSNLASEKYYEYFKDNDIYSNSTIYREIEENIIGDSFIKEYLIEDYVKMITFKLIDGTEVSQIASSSLWSAYRGGHVIDNLLSSSLMAFEKWLIDFINNENNKDDIENIYYKVLKESKSVLTTAVLASVGTGFFNIIKENIYPILQNINCYFYDEQRRNHENRNKLPIGYNIKKEYIDERKKSFNLHWRQNTLKNCILTLQINFENNNINCFKDNLFMLYSLIIIFVEQDLTYLKYIEDILKAMVNSSIKYSDIVRMDYNTFEYIEKSLAKYIFKLDKNHVNNLLIILNKACHKQPYLVFKLLLYLEEICETNNKFNMFWYVYSKISNTVKEIANSNKNMNYSCKVLLRHMLFTEVPWQKNDLKNQYIKYGKIHIVDYAKDTFSNIDTLIGMIKLMFYFNSIFFEDFILILADIDKDLYSKIDKNTISIINDSIIKYFNDSKLIIKLKIYDAIYIAIFTKWYWFC